jgi:hypothetical protein
MIRDVYITRIVDEGEGNRKFGFGITANDEQSVYLPGNMIAAFELGEDDVGTRNKMSVDEDRQGRSDLVAHTILIEDSALQQAYEWATEEIERLEGILKEHGIEYDE